MQTTVLDSPASASSILRRVLIFYGGLAILSLTFLYLAGELRFLAPWEFISWIFAANYALVLDYGRRLCVPPRRGHAYRALYFAPALVQVGQDMLRIIDIRFYERSTLEIIDLWLDVADVSLVILGVILLRSAYIAHATRPNVPAVELEASMSSANEASLITDIPSTLLGQGDGYIDRVIHSVIGRSMKSEHVASFSLAIMLVLVMIGGMASFGLWAFTHAERIHTLEDEKNKLISLQAGMKEIRDKLGTEDAKAQFDRLNQFIERNYPPSESYKDTLDRLSQQSQTNYADIAIRVTIAVLTIFLVQVFFSVYKYNRHLANMLAAKAEALELAGNDDDARKELSREAVSIVKEIVPGFGPYPRTPIEEALRVAERLGKRE